MSWWERTYIYRGMAGLPLTPSERILYFATKRITLILLSFGIQFILSYAWQRQWLNPQILGLSYLALESLLKVREVRADDKNDTIVGTALVNEREFARAKGVTLPDDAPPDTAAPPPATTS